MDTSSANFSLDLLTDNDRWVTRLARALISDGDEAEDVVQEARITLWTHPPDQTETARAWLRSVIRNLIRNRSRNRQRRALRLQRLGEPTAEASPHELMERFETQCLCAWLEQQSCATSAFCARRRVCGL